MKQISKRETVMGTKWLRKTTNKQKEKHVFWIWGSSSEVERLPSTQEALGSIPSAAKQNKTTHPTQEKAIS